MCLAIPGKVLSIDISVQPIIGMASFGGIEKSICLEWLPDVTVGDYVLVHVGFAISKLDEHEALETLKLFEEIEDADSALRIDEHDTRDGQNNLHESL